MKVQTWIYTCDDIFAEVEFVIQHCIPFKCRLHIFIYLWVKYKPRVKDTERKMSF